MINQTTSQQSKLYLKTISSASLVLGITSMVISGGGYIYIYGTVHSLLDSILIISSFLIPFTGLILGIIGIKTPKKIMALSGIVLSIIGLIGATFFNLLILFFHP